RDVCSADRAAGGRGGAAAARFVIAPALFQAARAKQSQESSSAERGARSAPTPPPAEEPTPDGAPRSTLRAPRSPAARRWRKLEEFVVGACNRVAHAAALSVVEEPGQHGNPLVLHGPVGHGQTRLLEGFCAGLRRNPPEMRVLFVPAEEFTNRFVAAIRAGKQAALRRQFREVDALLLDDLHFLATKKATHEEFLHTFDA